MFENNSDSSIPLSIPVNWLKILNTISREIPNEIGIRPFLALNPGARQVINQV